MKIELITPKKEKPARVRPKDLAIGQAMVFESGNTVIKLKDNLFLKFWVGLSAPTFLFSLESVGTDVGTLIEGEVVISVKVGQ